MITNLRWRNSGRGNISINIFGTLTVKTRGPTIPTETRRARRPRSEREQPSKDHNPVPLRHCVFGSPGATRRRVQVNGRSCVSRTPTAGFFAKAAAVHTCTTLFRTKTSDINNDKQCIRVSVASTTRVDSARSYNVTVNTVYTMKCITIRSLGNDSFACTTLRYCIN